MNSVIVRPVVVAAVLASSFLQASRLETGALSAGDARAGFEKLRSTVGTWTFTAGAEHGQVSYELVSGGTALLERVSSEELGETAMVSVIHLDGDRLVLQHYCDAGNQPRLVSSGLVGEEIRFTFESVTNLPTPSTGHIHGAAFHFAADGSFESRWTWKERGVEATSVRRHARVLLLTN